jgi:hypothetical protein
MAQKKFTNELLLLLLVLLTNLRRASCKRRNIKDDVATTNSFTLSFNATPPPPLIIDRIFLRRHRKAGSTTVFGYLLNVQKRITPKDIIQSSKPQNLSVDAMEYQSLNRACILNRSDTSSPGAQFAAVLMSPRIITITHLREPISRLNSEFWFRGPGFRTGAANESLWRDWMSEMTPLPEGGAPRITSLGTRKSPHAITPAPTMNIIPA